MTALAPLVLAGLGLAVLAVGALSLAKLWRDRRYGTLVAVDAGRPETLRSDRYRLAGRPDLMRRTPSGTLVPIELKHRDGPVKGPFRSHIVQVWAYCLLVEETTGQPPAFGVLRYRDQEVRIPWNPAARSDLLAIDRAVRGPYDGRATPSPGRCGRCAWAAVCDARAPPR